MLDSPMWRQSEPKARQHLKNMFFDTSLKWALEDMEKTINPPASQRLSEISKRVLLIIGSKDCQPIKEIARVLDAAITTVKRVDIQDTGHLPNLDKPDEFNKIVLKFLMNNKEDN